MAREKLAVSDRVTAIAAGFGIVEGREYEVIVVWGPFVAVRDVETDERFGYSEAYDGSRAYGNILASRFREVRDADRA